MSETQVNDAPVYSWMDMPTDQPMDKIVRRRIIGAQAMLSHVTLEQGCYVPAHEHVNEQFVCVLSGRLRFEIGAEGQTTERIVSGGEVLHLGSMVRHAAEVLEDSVVLDVFSPPSETTGIDR